MINRNYVGNDKYRSSAMKSYDSESKEARKGFTKTVLPPITEHIKNIMLWNVAVPGSKNQQVDAEKWNVPEDASAIHIWMIS